MDRASKDPFLLMEEIEKVLGICSYPMNWPIGVDGNFKGVYNRAFKQIELFQSEKHGQTSVVSTVGNISDKSFLDCLGEYYHKKLCDEIELLDMAGDSFDKKKVLEG